MEKEVHNFGLRLSMAEHGLSVSDASKILQMKESTFRGMMSHDISEDTESYYISRLNKACDGKVIRDGDFGKIIEKANNMKF